LTEELIPGCLDWDEVDPARHPFDPESAAEAVRSLEPARRMPTRPDVPYGDPVLRDWDREVAGPWADAMSYALAERYGDWAVGWRWAHDEGDFDGGPVGSWCCVRHSFTTPEETLDRVVSGLCEWREWLERLAARFEAYPLDLATVADQRILWECAARNLILQVHDRTGSGSLSSYSGGRAACNRCRRGPHTRVEVEAVQPVEGVVVEFDAEAGTGGDLDRAVPHFQHTGETTSSAEFHG
jgi:hypothetical protein